MRIMNILHDSVVDGIGLRTVVFFAGCPHHCRGCHNPQSWNMENGTELSLAEVVEEIASNPITNVTFSGGEPFAQAEEAHLLAIQIRKLGKSIWMYTGYTVEQLLAEGTEAQLALLEQCEMLVDGPFQLAERDLTIPFRGSRNQRLLSREDILRIRVELEEKQGILV
ncbi:anaerobic ribonucleoside-triphosphate reductase activating protein [Paenibacillus selenitireducens]|uniref:Anaerobic ribonucleoside-triphosphate reductase-activating protein n=1 Tax=Paenibacillus selenitireducens TaxID=1324314 RepID=A0A1T2XAT3_9BACL|nr:anaerobic ribonucleoside-triphosphate reductase activating protein [Paenibacillus selenitireducens]OPA76912.1 anaerobic ribonucleoside-triphosphate reductase activating protein [Paenibacillus selenitireducens]